MLTREEARNVYYATGEQPTIPGTVGPSTSLAELNLNWRERDLRERERTKHVHRLHPYLGKYIPQLVEIFLRKYFKPGQTVLDPFVGSGTTLVQANELGMNAIGYDISAFNIMLCVAKTHIYDLHLLEHEVSDVLAKVQQLARSAASTAPHQLSLNLDQTQPSSYEPETTNEYLNTWFAPQALRELLTYKSIIEQGNYQYKNILRVILSRSARSARLTTHFDLDVPKAPQREPYHCYKHSRECTPVSEAFKFLKRYSIDTIKRVRAFAQLRTEAFTHVQHLDSRAAQIPAIDGVITSPPYVGLIDYHEQHAYAYHLLGLQDKREHEIGPAASGSSRKACRAYQDGIVEVFDHIQQALPPRGRMIVVAGDRMNLYSEIAERLHVEVEAVIQRHVNRRTGRRSSDFYESVFIWRKPSIKAGPRKILKHSLKKTDQAPPHSVASPGSRGTI